jgi:hypothetical protein
MESFAGITTNLWESLWFVSQGLYLIRDKTGWYWDYSDLYDHFSAPWHDWYLEALSFAVPRDDD